MVDDGETLATIADASQDFIVANHFLEHTENPIGTIETHLSKLKPGGILFYAVPDKRYTFDFRRPVTPLEHMVADYEEGPERSRAEHYAEWCRLVIDEESDSVGTPEQAASEEWVARRAAELEAAKYSIHMHVWTQAEFLKLILDLRERLGDGFDLQAAASVAIEFIVVLRKAGPPPPPPPVPGPAPAGAGLGGAGEVGDPLQEGRLGRPQRGSSPEGTTIVRPQFGGTEAPLAIEARDLEKTFRIPTNRVDSIKERIVQALRRARLPRAAGARRRLLRHPPGRVLRHRRPQRLRQEHPAEAARQHLPGRRGDDPDGRAGWRRSSSSASASTWT